MERQWDEHRGRTAWGCSLGSAQSRPLLAGRRGRPDAAHLPLPYLMRMSRLRLSSLPSLNHR